MDTRYLEITQRTATGKGEAGRIRQKGIIPGVFYGPGRKTVSITVNPKALMDAIDTEAGENTLLTLKAKEVPELDKKVVILKDKQLHPITKLLVHVDLYEVDLAKKIIVEIPVVCHGKPLGLEDGGILQVVQRQISVECLPTNIPEKIEIDVSPLKIGDAIHIKDMTPPSGVEFKFDTNFTIVTVAAPMKEEVVAAPVAEAVVVEGAVPVAAGAEGAAPAGEGAPAASGAAPTGDKGKGTAPGGEKGKGAAPAGDKAKGAPDRGKGPDKK